MAGSYNHLISREGKNEYGEDHGLGGWDLIGNMGDAFECVEELWWLVERAIGQDGALNLLDSEFHPMKRGELPPDEALNTVNEGMNREHSERGDEA